MMAARSGKADAVNILLDRGAKVNAAESWGGTTALMWAVSELVLRSSASGRGFEGTAPVPPKPDQAIEEFASGLLTPLMFAARENALDSAKLLVKAGADLNAREATERTRCPWRSSMGVTTLRISWSTVTPA
jgi:ankyrin repeat protein